MKMRNFLKSLLSLLVSLVCLFIFLWIFGTTLESALKKDEERQCIQLKEQAQERRKDLFFLTPQEKAQCDRIGITINAQVKKEVRI